MPKVTQLISDETSFQIQLYVPIIMSSRFLAQVG